MFVKLKRNLFTGSHRFKKGVREIPDHIDGLPVISAKDSLPAGKYFMLPSDAEILKSEPVMKAEVQVPVALSQMGKQKSKTMVEVLKKSSDDEE